MINKLPTDIHCCLHKVRKPYQYIGEEYSAYNKNFDEAFVHVALMFPDKYEIAVSNLGQKVLYDFINSDEKYMADRVYAPEVDFYNILREKDIPLYALESKRNVKDFDIIGISLQYELAYPTVLQMLKLSGISVLRKERTENEPIVMAGGPSCFNPKPMEKFIDLFMIGDGEELFIEVLDKYDKYKKEGLSRHEIILKLSQIEGIYSSELKNITKKRVFDISKSNKTLKAPVPYSSSVHDRSVIEIRRGCGRMCRFCQAGHVTLPVRERKAEDVISMVKDSVAQTGYDEYSLLSLSSNDYTNIESVIECLSDSLNDKKISVSLPSQRIDRYSQNLARLVRGVRNTTVTLAPEAGSQRLRNVINKNLTEEQIINTILNCYENGFASVKLYFMIGLPTETYEDLDETAELFRKIKYRAKEMKSEHGFKDSLNLTCTVSIFVPKPFTPFQWCAQFSSEEIRERINYLLDKVKPIKGVKINYHNGFTSKLECAISRGDERYGDFFYKLFEKGAYLTTWDEYVDKYLWLDCAKECGIDFNDDVQKEYDVNESLPWDVIDVGIDKSWFVKQYENALNGISITPCEFGCVNCGVCKNLKTHKTVDGKFVYEPQESSSETEKEVFRYRLKMQKLNEMKYISHLDWQNTVTKMLFRSGLKLNFSQGFNPTPKFSLGIALPVYVEGENELIDIELCEYLEEENLKNIFNAVLPENIRIKSALWLREKTTAIDILAQWAEYSFSTLKKDVLKNEDLLYIKNEISSSDEIFIEKINKKGVKKLVNIKTSIKSVDVSGSILRMILKTGQSDEIPSVKPEDVIKLYAPDIEFKIVRETFFDSDMNRL